MAELTSILIVEDDTAIRESLAIFLVMEGYEVFSCGDGREAQKVLEIANRRCLIFTDLRMPNMDGFALIRWLKQHESYATLPIVVISTLAETYNLSGVAEQLGKPFDLRDIMALVHKYGVKLRN